MRNLRTVAFNIIACMILFVMALPVQGAPTQVLIKNVNIFDGKTDTLAIGQDVLVEGNLSLGDEGWAYLSERNRQAALTGSHQCSGHEI
jgi:hypothetical protein